MLLVLVLLTSCNLFSDRKEASGKDKSPVVGLWRLDSISAPEGKGEMALLALALAGKDSSFNDFYFTKDSVFYDFSDADTTRAGYQFNRETNVLVLTAQDEVDTLQYELTKDSTMILTGNDSVSLYFRRKQ